MIEVNTESYEKIHGERPRGRPFYWSFAFEGMDPVLSARDSETAAAKVRRELATYGDGAHVDVIIFGAHHPIFHASRYTTFTRARKQARLFAKGIGATRIRVMG